MLLPPRMIPKKMTLFIATSQCLEVRQDGLDTVLDLDPQGRLTVLYPERSSERSVLEAGVVRVIPGSDARSRIRVVPPFGTDQVFVVAFAKSPDFLADFAGARPFTVDSPKAEKIANAIREFANDSDVQQFALRTYASRTDTGVGCERAGIP